MADMTSFEKIQLNICDVHSISRFITGNWRRFQNLKASTTSLQPFHFVVERPSRRKTTKTMTASSVNLRYEDICTLICGHVAFVCFFFLCPNLSQSQRYRSTSRKPRHINS